MRLKTKFQDKDFELGETAEVSISSLINNKLDKTIKVYAKSLKNGTYYSYFYDSIKDFTDHWEDAPEEPKGIIKVEKSIFPTSVYIEYSTEEEAEKAVEKLKAFTRLKDKGFRFIDWELDMKTVADGKIWFDLGGAVDADTALEDKSVKASMDLLFGGEE